MPRHCNRDEIRDFSYREQSRKWARNKMRKLTWTHHKTTMGKCAYYRAGSTRIQNKATLLYDKTSCFYVLRRTWICILAQRFTFLWNKNIDIKERKKDRLGRTRVCRNLHSMQWIASVTMNMSYETFCLFYTLYLFSGIYRIINSLC